MPCIESGISSLPQKVSLLVERHVYSFAPVNRANHLPSTKPARTVVYAFQTVRMKLKKLDGPQVRLLVYCRIQQARP